MDAQQVTEGISVAQAVATFVTGLGAVEGFKWLVNRRDENKKAQAESDHQQDERDQKQARETRKDTVKEHGSLPDRAERRIDVLEARVDTLNEKHLECETRAASLEMRVEACEEDRKDQRSRIDASERDRAELRNRLDALTKTVNGVTK